MSVQRIVVMTELPIGSHSLIRLPLDVVQRELRDTFPVDIAVDSGNRILDGSLLLLRRFFCFSLRCLGLAGFNLHCGSRIIN